MLGVGEPAEDAGAGEDLDVVVEMTLRGGRGREGPVGNVRVGAEANQ